MVKWKYFSEAEFIYNGEWNDSQLEYKGQLFNCPTIEDSIYSSFNEYANEEGIEINEENYTEYCNQNQDLIQEIFEHIMNERELESASKIKSISESELFSNVAHNLASDIAENSEDETLEDLEVNWLESTDEYVVNFGDELLFDGLTEIEAENLKMLLENKAIEIAESMKGGD